MSGARPQTSERRDLWIPACFVLFFVALAGLQLWFVLLANRTFTGLVTDPRPPVQAHGIAPATDWSARLSFTQTGPLAGTLRLALLDNDGKPVMPDELRSTAERTTRFPQLLPIGFKPVGPGLYEAAVKLPLAGEWAVRVELARNGTTTERVETMEIEP